MLKSHVDQLDVRERILANAIEPIALDLYLLEAADLIAFLRTGGFASISCLVNSSVELCFRPGILRFASSGDVEVPWTSAPRIALDMEFCHGGVQACFRLVLGAGVQLVELTYITFEQPRVRAADNTVLLSNALMDARLP
jgi:hypothetical protein